MWSSCGWCDHISDLISHLLNQAGVNMSARILVMITLFPLDMLLYCGKHFSLYPCGKHFSLYPFEYILVGSGIITNKIASNRTWRVIMVPLCRAAWKQSLLNVPLYFSKSIHAEQKCWMRNLCLSECLLQLLLHINLFALEAYYVS